MTLRYNHIFNYNNPVKHQGDQLFHQYWLLYANAHIIHRAKGCFQNYSTKVKCTTSAHDQQPFSKVLPKHQCFIPKYPMNKATKVGMSQHSSRQILALLVFLRRCQNSSNRPIDTHTHTHMHILLSIFFL